MRLATPSTRNVMRNTSRMHQVDVFNVFTVDHGHPERIQLTSDGSGVIPHGRAVVETVQSNIQRAHPYAFVKILAPCTQGLCIPVGTSRKLPSFPRTEWSAGSRATSG